MLDKNLTDREIIKILELCSSGDITKCHQCPLFNKSLNNECKPMPLKEILYLINCLQVKNEKLITLLDKATDCIYECENVYYRTENSRLGSAIREWNIDGKEESERLIEEYYQKNKESE